MVNCSCLYLNSKDELLGYESLKRAVNIVRIGTTYCGSSGKESTCNVGDLGSIPGLGRSPGKGKDYPFQYSGLENPTVHGTAKSRTRLSDFHFH